MLLRAARELRFELDNAVIIGDSDSDLLAGRAADTSTILLRPGADGPPAASADTVADDLASAVRLILQAGNATEESDA
jgi:D-glycero-D-manno-heptose 1,7-bisphosphate phosphatase